MADNVIVTGGADSVGWVMAERFLARGDRVHICGGGFAEQARAGDAIQRPLLRRSRFQPQLMPGVGLTARGGDGVRRASKTK